MIKVEKFEGLNEVLIWTMFNHIILKQDLMEIVDVSWEKLEIKNMKLGSSNINIKTKTQHRYVKGWKYAVKLYANVGFLIKSPLLP